MNQELQTLLAKKLPSVRRQPVALASEALVKTETLTPDSNLPLVIQPASGVGTNLASWTRNNRDFIESRLTTHGAILFRDFKLKTVSEFEQFVRAVCGDMLEYRERSSPRSAVGERVYTSTDHPEDQSIFLHNENSYARTLPLKLFFFCQQAAQVGGETPLADTRKILARIDPKIRKKFIQKKWMYVRNYGSGFGLSWQAVYQTTDTAVVEAYCRRTGIEFEWKADGGLRTRQVRPAVIKHPRTGELAWFNHATFFHVTTLEAGMRDALLAEFKEEDLPNNTYYGDGSAIESSVLDELRDAYQQEAIIAPWQTGDVVLLDNVLTSHARRPYSGPRKILFAMAEPFQRTDC